MAGYKNKLDGTLSAFDAAYPGQGKALAAILDDTPQLKARFNQAAEAGQLTGFDSTGAGGSGRYNSSSGVIGLPSDGLTGGSLAAPEDVNAMRIIAGHEIGHALNRDSIRATNAQFQGDVDALAQSSGNHDYTNMMAQRGQLQRTREAIDEIQGVNALAEYVRGQNSRATLKDLYRASPFEMDSYIQRSGSGPHYRYRPRGGLVFDDNLQIDPNKPENVEAMGKLFYDARGYPQSYGEVGMRIIANAEAQAQKDNPGRAAPAVYVDLPALGIDPSALAPDAIPANFIPTKAPAVSHAPANTQETSATGNQRLSAQDQALDQHLRSELAQLEARFGKPWDADSERMSASLSLLAARSGFTADDAPSICFSNASGQQPAGTLVFLSREAEGSHCDPYLNRAHMSTAQALSAPPEQSYDQLQAHREQEQRQANQQQPNDNPAHSQQAEQAQHGMSPGR
jgi:hypothetical protein